jgi:hypothetical protein
LGHRLSTILVICVCLLGLNEVLWGQTAGRGIRGYLDPETGTFHVLPHATDDAVPPPATTFSGKFVFNFTITVDATIASTAKIECLATALVEDNVTGGSPNIITEEAAVVATRSGTTATCTVNIPYSWSLVTGSTDKVNLGYTIQAPSEVAATAALPARISSQQNFASISIPTGTTTETITATF